MSGIRFGRAAAAAALALLSAAALMVGLGVPGPGPLVCRAEGEEYATPICVDSGGGLLQSRPLWFTCAAVLALSAVCVLFSARRRRR